MLAFAPLWPIGISNFWNRDTPIPPRYSEPYLPSGEYYDSGSFVPDPYTMEDFSGEKQASVSAHGEFGQKVTWDMPGLMSLGPSTSEKRNNRLRTGGSKSATQHLGLWPPLQPHSEMEPSSSSISDAGLNPVQPTSFADISGLPEAEHPPSPPYAHIPEIPTLVPEGTLALEADSLGPHSGTPSTDPGPENPAQSWTLGSEDQNVTHASHGLAHFERPTGPTVCHFCTVARHLLTATTLSAFPFKFPSHTTPISNCWHH